MVAVQQLLKGKLYYKLQMHVLSHIPIVQPLALVLPVIALSATSNQSATRSNGAPGLQKVYGSTCGRLGKRSGEWSLHLISVTAINSIMKHSICNVAHQKMQKHAKRTLPAIWQLANQGIH
jgi:hypothetical protein